MDLVEKEASSASSSASSSPSKSSSDSESDDHLVSEDNESQDKLTKSSQPRIVTSSKQREQPEASKSTSQQQDPLANDIQIIEINVPATTSEPENKKRKRAEINIETLTAKVSFN